MVLDTSQSSVSKPACCHIEQRRSIVGVHTHTRAVTNPCCKTPKRMVWIPRFLESCLWMSGRNQSQIRTKRRRRNNLHFDSFCSWSSWGDHTRVAETHHVVHQLWASVMTQSTCTSYRRRGVLYIRWTSFLPLIIANKAVALALRTATGVVAKSFHDPFLFIFLPQQLHSFATRLSEVTNTHVYNKLKLTTRLTVGVLWTAIWWSV